MKTVNWSAGNSIVPTYSHKALFKAPELGPYQQTEPSSPAGLARLDLYKIEETDRYRNRTPTMCLTLTGRARIFYFRLREFESCQVHQLHHRNGDVVGQVFVSEEFLFEL